MEGWYWIGLCAGVGVAGGVLLAGAAGASRPALAAAVLVAVAAGVALGLAIGDAGEAIGGGVGGAAGSLGSAHVVRGALRRGGTRGATAALVALAAVGLAALAVIPGVGYLETVAVPALAARLRRRGGRRYAGLRVLARDE